MNPETEQFLLVVPSPVPTILVQCSSNPKRLDGQGAVPRVCLRHSRLL